MARARRCIRGYRRFWREYSQASRWVRTLGGYLDVKVAVICACGKRLHHGSSASEMEQAVAQCRKCGRRWDRPITRAEWLAAIDADKHVIRLPAGSARARGSASDHPLIKRR